MKSVSEATDPWQLRKAVSKQSYHIMGKCDSSSHSSIPRHTPWRRARPKPHPHAGAETQLITYHTSFCSASFHSGCDPPFDLPLASAPPVCTCSDRWPAQPCSRLLALEFFRLGLSQELPFSGQSYSLCPGLSGTFPSLALAREVLTSLTCPQVTIRQESISRQLGKDKFKTLKDLHMVLGSI